jgi:hypothetical protein
MNNTHMQTRSTHGGWGVGGGRDGERGHRGRVVEVHMRTNARLDGGRVCQVIHDAVCNLGKGVVWSGDGLWRLQVSQLGLREHGATRGLGVRSFLWERFADGVAAARVSGGVVGTLTHQRRLFHDGGHF